MHCEKSLKTAKILRAAFLFSFVCRSRYKYWFRMKFAAQQTHTHTERQRLLMNGADRGMRDEIFFLYQQQEQQAASHTHTKRF